MNVQQMVYSCWREIHQIVRVSAVQAIVLCRVCILSDIIGKRPVCVYVCKRVNTATISTVAKHCGKYLPSSSYQPLGHGRITFFEHKL